MRVVRKPDFMFFRQDWPYPFGDAAEANSKWQKRLLETERRLRSTALHCLYV